MRADRGSLGVTLGTRSPAFGMTLDTVFGTVFGTARCSARSFNHQT